MKINPTRAAKALALFILLVALDLFTKSAAVNALKGGKRIPLIPGVLEFYYIQNRGAAFGMFQNGTFILSLVSLAALVVLVLVYLKVPDGRKYLPLRLVLIFIAAGAAGNLYDRITLKYVRDFIYFSLIDFPVFNVADIYVTCSVFILAFLIFFRYKEEDLQFISSQEQDRAQHSAEDR
ncbi:MAG: signal peptidase II [Lachnospiraceae bacterium]|nr:signal peptidase II [Lachnospiraceae bacterium]